MWIAQNTRDAYHQALYGDIPLSIGKDAPSPGAGEVPGKGGVGGTGWLTSHLTF